jgi:zinc transport system permease protein
MTIELFLQYFQITLFVRGFFVGLAIALMGSQIGHFLVLKKMSLIGDGLAHVAYLSIAVSVIFFNQSILINVLFAVIASLTLTWFSQKRGYTDALIGAMATTAIALGTILITLNPQPNISIEKFLFGSVLLIREIDAILAIILAFVTTLVVSFFFRHLQIAIFDQDYAKVSRLRPSLMHYVLAILTALVISIGIRAVGSLLISSFIIFPTLISIQYRQGFFKTWMIGMVHAVIVFILGYATSLWFDLPTGATIVIGYATIFVMTRLVMTIVNKR